MSVLKKAGSGFYVSPTTMADRSIADEVEQSRYANPLRITAADHATQPCRQRRGDGVVWLNQELRTVVNT